MMAPCHSDATGLPRRRDPTFAPDRPSVLAGADGLSAAKAAEPSDSGPALEARIEAGDSAGGGLTLALIGQLQAAGKELPACAWLLSPWTDLTMSGSTLATKASIDPLIHDGYLHELADAYLPGSLDRKNARVSPLYADLTGLPPILI